MISLAPSSPAQRVVVVGIFLSAAVMLLAAAATQPGVVKR